MFGTQIGFKFNQDGSPARYRGNTIVSDIYPDNPAYPVLRETLQHIDNAGLSRLLIKLPSESYHVTIIRGLNDSVRTAKFWPSELSVNATLPEMDEYVIHKLAGLPFPAAFTMTFQHLQWNDEDVRIALVPASPEEEERLRAFRDDIADRLRLRLPGHESYTFHTTLAYTFYRPQEKDNPKIKQIINDFSTHHSGTMLNIASPRLAFYEDMTAFPSERKKERRSHFG